MRGGWNGRGMLVDVGEGCGEERDVHFVWELRHGWGGRHHW